MNKGFNSSLQLNALSGTMSLRELERFIQVTRSTALSQHTAAITVLSSGRYAGFLQTIVSDNGKRKTIRARSREELDDKLVDYYTKVAEPTKHSIKSCFEGWVEDLKINKRPSTIHAYEKVFRRHFSSIENLNIEEMSAYDIKTFVKREVAEKQLTAKGYSALKTDLLGIYHYAKDKEYVDVRIDDIVQDLGRQLRGTFHKANKTFKKEEDFIFSDEEIQKLSKYCSESELLTDLGILILFGTGLRIGELAALKKEDLLRDCKEISVSRTEERVGSGADYIVSETPKTDAGIRNVLVTKDVTRILKMVLGKSSKQSGYLFSDNEFDRYPAKKFRDRLYRLCKILKIPKRSPHAIRRTYASKLYEAGISEHLIIKQMGHIDFEVTKSFYIYNRKSVEEVISELERAI